jgi:hypothetical protein
MTHLAETNAPPDGPLAWTNVRVALLIRLRGEGIKRWKIADIINIETGSNFTRAAVSGKIDRIYTAANPKKTPEEKAATIRAQRERDNEKKRQERKARLEASTATLKQIRPRPFICQPAPDIQPLNLTFAQLEPGDNRCRYSYGDDPKQMVFCGHPFPENSRLSFCAAHLAVCVGRGTESERRAA